MKSFLFLLLAFWYPLIGAVILVLNLDYPFIRVFLLCTAVVMLVIVQIIDPIFISTDSLCCQIYLFLIVVCCIFDQMEYPWLQTFYYTDQTWPGCCQKIELKE